MSQEWLTSSKTDIQTNKQTNKQTKRQTIGRSCDSVYLTRVQHTQSLFEASSFRGQFPFGVIHTSDLSSDLPDHFCRGLLLTIHVYPCSHGYALACNYQAITYVNLEVFGGVVLRPIHNSLSLSTALVVVSTSSTSPPRLLDRHVPMLATNLSRNVLHHFSRSSRLAASSTVTMKFGSLSILALTVHAASAWAPVGVGAARPGFALFSAITSEQVGEAATESFRLQFKGEDGADISAWHDIPLKGSGDSYNMVVEIPKMTKAKMEVSTKEKSNPIAQDIKKGKLRDYHGPIFWNYGCLPQTWEDPNAEHPELKIFGDDDPIDVVEIGSAALAMGSVKEVKVLGVLGMIDDGELDWKVLAIATDDELASTFNDVDDVPDSIKAGIREWFRWYKTPDDKPVNAFGFDEKFLDVAATKEIIEETHVAWQKLRSGDTDAGKLWTGN